MFNNIMTSLMKLQLLESLPEPSNAELEKQTEDGYDVEWHMAKCACGITFNMLTCRHDGSYLVCPNGHRL